MLSFLPKLGRGQCQESAPDEGAGLGHDGNGQEAPLAPDERIPHLEKNMAQGKTIQEVSAMLANLTSECQRVVIREQRKRKQLRAEMGELKEKLRKLAPGDPKAEPIDISLVRQTTSVVAEERGKELEAVLANLSNASLEALLHLENRLKDMVKHDQQKTQSLSEEVAELRADLALLQENSRENCSPSSHADPNQGNGEAPFKPVAAEAISTQVSCMEFLIRAPKICYVDAKIAVVELLQLLPCM